MIDPRELRIGNWITAYGGETNVLGIIGNWITTTACAEKEGLYFENAIPIPLTSEWLERFGFLVVKGPVIDFYHRAFPERNRLLSVTVQGGNQYITIAERDVFDFQQTSHPIVLFNGDYDGVLHVHQLQNLYFCLTGKELTLKDNQ